MNHRQENRKGQNQTKIVISIYMLLFLGIGFFGDFMLVLSSLGDGITTTNVFYSQSDTLGESFLHFLRDVFSGTHLPLFTIVAGSIAGLIVWISITFGDRLLLKGEEYILLNDKENLTPEEQQLLNIVEEISLSARLRHTPKVYIIDAPYMNAFASGWKEENSMVAITTALLEKLTRSEITAVMAHEIGHIRNEDVKLTMLVGILTNILLFIVDHIFYFMIKTSGDDNKFKGPLTLIFLILNITLPILTIVLQMYLSRTREYMADAASVEFTYDKEAMINALLKISGDYKENFYNNTNPMRRAAYLFDPSSLFSTHPSVEKRIAALEGKRN
jgi:heat shock protein HtpX